MLVVIFAGHDESRNKLRCQKRSFSHMKPQQFDHDNGQMMPPQQQSTKSALQCLHLWLGGPGTMTSVDCSIIWVREKRFWMLRWRFVTKGVKDWTHSSLKPKLPFTQPQCYRVICWVLRLW
jgi:hypothetical protein